MKKLTAICGLLLFGQLLTFGAVINLLYPVGGEKLPVNGIHVFTWTNSDNLPFNLYVDWYDTNNNPVLADMSLYATTLAMGTNSFTFYMPSNYPGPEMYRYKVHLVGNDGYNIESSSDYVYVTAPATFEGTIANTNAWLPGQSREISISWSGFQSNDSYDVILEAPTLNKTGYGFLMTNIVMGSETGTQVVNIPYPSNQTPAYPPSSYAPMNGSHAFTIINRRCGIIQTFGDIDLLTAGLRLALLPSDTTNVLRGEAAVCAKVRLDATLATNDVTVTLVKLVLTSYSSNTVALKCTMSSTGSTQSTANVSVTPQVSRQFDTIVEFPMNVTVPQGTVMEMAIATEVLAPSGLGTFIWNTQNGSTNVLASVSAVYAGGAEVNTRIISSSGSYMNIGEAVHH